MKDLLALVFAVAVGLVAGTLPGIREKFPWGQPSDAETKAKQAAIAAQASAATSTPPPAAGSWLYDANSRTGTLEKKAIK
jgi:hypothetical protein